MELETRTEDAVDVLRCSGRLTMADAPRPKAAVQDSVGSGRNRLVVDLAGVTFVDSSGLGALVGGLKTARQAGGDLRIAGAGEQVAMVLEMTNLNRVLRAYPSVSEAADGWG